MKKLYVPFFALLLGLSGLFFLLQPSHAAGPKGVGLLRGRWTGTLIQDQDSHSLDLRLDDGIADPNDPNKLLFSGCLALDNGTLVPAAAVAGVSGDQVNFDLSLVSTNMLFPNSPAIQLLGHVAANGASHKDDIVSDTSWSSGGVSGVWTATHHDRRNLKCPAAELTEGGLRFSADLYTSLDANLQGAGPLSIFEVYTNIASSRVKITPPSGPAFYLPQFTDIFSPQVDFLEEFRYVEGIVGMPQSLEEYTFTLEDVTGHPIAGAQAIDTYTACPQVAPSNIGFTVEPTGLLASWTPVTPVPGFDPGNQIGFYSIEMGEYGANTRQASHLIPFANFDADPTGYPDGQNYGQSLDSFPDGIYRFDVISFVGESDNVGIECQIRDSSESPSFEKAGGVYTAL